MNIFARIISVSFAIAVLAGCAAGTNFKRPEAQALQLGKSNLADVTRVMGPAPQTGESLRNGEKLKVSRYAYAEGAGKGKYPDVVPARAMVFLTHNDLLVGEEFVSSFHDDATDFDESKIGRIVKGKTTKAEVLALMGKPNGAAVYPFIKAKGDTAVLYSYGQSKGSVFNMKFYNKTLIVSFGPNNVVTDVEYSSNGEK